MALGFRFMASEASTELTGGETITDVQRTTFMAEPANVSFTVAVEPGDDLAGRSAAAAAPIAEAFNAASATPGVEALSTGQEQTPAGTLIDTVNVIVSSTSGRASTSISVPQSVVAAGELGPAVAEARAQLDALEGI